MKSLIRKLAMLMVLALIPAALFAQTTVVSGTVVDDSNQGLLVSVSLKMEHKTEL